MHRLIARARACTPAGRALSPSIPTPAHARASRSHAVLRVSPCAGCAFGGMALVLRLRCRVCVFARCAAVNDDAGRCLRACTCARVRACMHMFVCARASAREKFAFASNVRYARSPLAPLHQGTRLRQQTPPCGHLRGRATRQGARRRRRRRSSRLCRPSGRCAMGKTLLLLLTPRALPR